MKIHSLGQIPADYNVNDHEVEDGFYHSVVLGWPKTSRESEFSCRIKGRRQGSKYELIQVMQQLI